MNFRWLIILETPYPFGWNGYAPTSFNGQASAGASRGPGPAGPPPGFSPEMLYSGARFPGVYPYAYAVS